MGRLRAKFVTIYSSGRASCYKEDAARTRQVGDQANKAVLLVFSTPQRGNQIQRYSKPKVLLEAIRSISVYTLTNDDHGDHPFCG